MELHSTLLIVYSVIIPAFGVMQSFYNVHLNTCGHLTELRNKPQKKTSPLLLVVSC